MSGETQDVEITKTDAPRNPDVTVRMRTAEKYRARAEAAEAALAAERERAASETPAVLYHWSPSQNRTSIGRNGLRPGSPSNTFPEWTPPYICYGDTPSTALGLTLLDEALDLWMVHTSGHHFLRANDGTEWRTDEQVPAWFVGTRPPRDPVVDMTSAEQAEADEVVGYLHEERIEHGEDDD